MYYSGVRRGVFVERPNRFIAHAELGGQRVVCHVKIPGAARSDKAKETHMDKLTPFQEKEKNFEKGFTKRGKLVF